MEGEQLHAVVHAIGKDNRKWVDFMMRFELGIEEPDPKRASHSAFTIALSYIVGGLIPLVPYFFVEHAPSALRFSISLTLIALFVFGVVKGRFTGLRPLRSGLQTVIIGGIAAAVAFTIARLIS